VLNAQAVVDADHQVIIATDLNNCAADSQTFTPMMAQARRNTGRAPKQALADAGYCSQANLEDAAKLTEQDGTEFLIAPSRIGHDENVEPAPRGRIPKDLTLKQRMARKLRTQTGKADYARRKRSLSRSSVRSPPCRANTSCSAAWTTARDLPQPAQTPRPPRSHRPGKAPPGHLRPRADNAEPSPRPSEELTAAGPRHPPPPRHSRLHAVAPCDHPQPVGPFRPTLLAWYP